MKLTLKVICCILIFGIISIILFFCGKRKLFQVTDPERTLTDEQLLEYARSPYDKKKMMHKKIIIGKHNGVPVKVSFPCGDLCPEYTKRIISYDVELDRCEEIGGVKKTIFITRGIAAIPENFCIPKILAEHNLYEK